MNSEDDFKVNKKFNKKPLKITQNQNGVELSALHSVGDEGDSFKAEEDEQ